MIHLKLTTDGITRPDGTYVVTITDLPGAVIRDILPAMIRRLESAGYRVDDTRPAPSCPQCGKPVTGQRHRLCSECKPVPENAYYYTHNRGR